MMLMTAEPSLGFQTQGEWDIVLAKSLYIGRAMGLSVVKQDTIENVSVAYYSKMMLIFI